MFMHSLLVSLLPHLCVAAASSGFIPEALHLYSCIVKVSSGWESPSLLLEQLKRGKRNPEGAASLLSQPHALLPEPRLWHKLLCSPLTCHMWMRKVEPDRESAPSKMG